MGRRLTKTAMRAASGMGYKSIRLDTLPEMAAAQRLYERLGFRDIPAYYGEPIDGQRFMEAVLG
jgi:ribosomal protein S18 acetylase RimI-like enzyme